MSQPDRILTPDKAITPATSLNATTAASAVAVGERKIFVVSASGTIHVTFGNSAVAAPSASVGLVLPTGAHVFYSSTLFDYIRVFNPGASAITYSIYTCAN